MSYHFTADRLETFSEYYYSDMNITCSYIYTRGTRGVCNKPCIPTVYGNRCVCETHKQIYSKERADYQKLKQIELLEARVYQLQREQGHGFLSTAFGRKPAVAFDKIPSVIERSTECSVCYNTSELLNLPCGHVTCYSCYTKLPKEECPVCREKIIDNLVKRI